MESRYEYLERLPKAVWGGFQLREGRAGTIQYMGFIASRNGQDGPFSICSAICPPIPSNGGQCKIVEDKDRRDCSLSDLTEEEFQRLSLLYPRDELEELRELERQYKDTVIAYHRERLDRDLARTSQR